MGASHLKRDQREEPAEKKISESVNRIDPKKLLKWKGKLLLGFSNLPLDLNYLLSNTEIRYSYSAMYVQYRSSARPSNSAKPGQLQRRKDGENIKYRV